MSGTIKRRNFLAAAPAALLPAHAQTATRGLPAPIIKDVSVIATAPAGLRLSVVKITTDQDGLYGYGCATFTQRADLVNAAVEKYLKPFLIGKHADRIEDIWQACYDSSYWRNGPVLNNAISGVDQALWDIKGRQAGMPVYQLLGGKCREAADCYTPRRRRRDSSRPSTRPANSWTRASATCACRWACPAWRAMAPAPGDGCHERAATKARSSSRPTTSAAR